MQGEGHLPRAGGALAAGIAGCQRQTSAHLERAKGAGEAPRPEPAGNQTSQAGAAPQGEGPGRGGGIANRLTKVHAYWGKNGDD